MRSLPARGGVFRFSTAALPEASRLEIWREEFGRKHARVDFEPVPQTDFDCSVTVRMLPGLSILKMVSNGFRFIRTPELVTDGADDFFLNFATEGIGVSHQLGREVTSEPGEGLLVSCTDAGWALFPRQVKYISLRLSRPALKALAVEPEAALMKNIPRQNGAFRLLREYVSILDRQAAPGMEPALGSHIAEHIQDLVALALGAARDGAELAKGRGLAAARLCTIKTDIVRNLSRRDLSITFIAARHRVSPRYIQMLFETEGRTFSGFVLTQRLALVRRQLVNPVFADRTIGEIALDAGFGDFSHFRRAFHRQYGATPSEVRSAALAGGGEPE